MMIDTAAMIAIAMEEANRIENNSIRVISAALEEVLIFADSLVSLKLGHSNAMDT